MTWIKLVKDEVVNACCGICLGTVKALFGLSLYTAEEAEEIEKLKKLAVSVIEKSPPPLADPNFCHDVSKGLQTGNKFLIETSYPFLPNAAAAAADIVCSKAILPRFQQVLAGACFNLIGC